MTSKNKISLELARECFDYLPETGQLRWRERPAHHFKTVRSFIIWNARYAGTIAGTKNTNGHRQISINSRVFLAHLITWLMVTGAWPDQEIDHIDTDKDNNRFSNLRKCTHAKNMFNTSKRKTNKSGIKGVCWHKQEQKWRAQITFEGKKYSARFHDIELATEWVRAKRNELHEEFANHGV